MATPSTTNYDAFLEEVECTVYVDNISTQVTESVLRSALDQFGTVKKVQFIPNFTGPANIPQCALVEMDSSKQVTDVIAMINQFHFMISGMPRPVRARRAEPEMFENRPSRPNRKIQCRWLHPSDPEFETAKKMKRLTQKHAAEAAFLLKQQLQKEEELAKQQEEILKGNYKKHEMIQSVLADGTARRLARRYNMHLGDE
ncbi:hypothetical protein UlMin_012239 [Ulmus minor]